jgi:hypothetical protein
VILVACHLCLPHCGTKADGNRFCQIKSCKLAESTSDLKGMNACKIKSQQQVIALTAGLFLPTAYCLLFYRQLSI